MFDDWDLGEDAAIRRLPRDLRGLSPNLSHWHAIGQVARQVRNWFPRAQTRVDRDRREAGRPASKRRPDIQFYNPQRRRSTHIEVDTHARGMRGHIAARDPRRRSVFLRVDPATGALVEKRVFPAGSNRAQITRARPGQSLQLRREDVFDEGAW